MEREIIKVRSESNFTIVIDLPELQVHRTWRKAGQEYPFERSVLQQAFYDPSVEYLFRHGMLSTDDVQFKVEVGLMEEEKDVVAKLNDTQKMRIIKLMPLVDVKKELAKLSVEQLNELAEFAIEHYKDLSMDRVDVLSKASGRNILKSIENYKRSLED